MRVMLTTIGSRGDVQPLVAFAARLRELGADVVMCAPPDPEFEELLARYGVEPVPLGQAARPMISADKPRLSDAPKIAARMVADQYDTVIEAGEGCDAIVATGMTPAGVRLAAERLDIRYRHACSIPRVLPSPHHAPLPRPGKPFPEGETDNEVLWAIDAENLQHLYGVPLNRIRARLGLEPIEDVRGYVYTDRPWLASDPVLGPWPETEGLDVVQTGAWILPDERPLPDDLEAFLDSGEPPVYIGFGSMPWLSTKNAAQSAMRLVRDQGRRAIVSRGWADLGLLEDGDDWFALGEANHRKLFPRVAAVVHHGGAGTTTTAAAAGAPQVVVPQIADQPYWSERVARLGIGAGLDTAEPTVEAFAAALESALDPRTVARARAVGGEVRTDGAETAARLLVGAS
ncbi:glycosyltransferase [Glycomyces xiaoerkulensis]|uniref:glycosyltransferase n=1 Tax=Glycomyces xiaoerkulensis TaxID=2038139 RepID=UPI000C26217B|nr:glycosyltransferase [Glycomyces xiaoerkulensis]